MDTDGPSAACAATTGARLNLRELTALDYRWTRIKKPTPRRGERGVAHSLNQLLCVSPRSLQCYLPTSSPFCEDFPGARLSQPQPPRLPTVVARLREASFCFCTRSTRSYRAR